CASARSRISNPRRRRRGCTSRLSGSYPATSPGGGRPTPGLPGPRRDRTDPARPRCVRRPRRQVRTLVGPVLGSHHRDGGIAVVMRPALAATKTAKSVEGVPAIKHAFVIVLENEDYAASWGPNSPAHYLNSLRGQGAFADDYYGVSHLSADNYIAITSGQPPAPPFQMDCPDWGVCETSEKARLDGGRNLADQIEEHHLSWAGFMDSMPGTCIHGPAAGPDTFQGGAGAADRYATRHDPFVYYPS